MKPIELAERKAHARALTFILFAAMSLGLLLASYGDRGTDYMRGMWVGITGAAAVALLPLGRWLKRTSVVARLLDDEATREHRRTSGTAGFWAAVIAGIAVTLVARDGVEGVVAISPFDVARVIVTAAVATALVGFAALELRAARS